MPAFVSNGPDIPESLLQAHEEGKVVFFCGAGISVPAGLPSFKRLVDKIYEELGETKYPAEKTAYEDKQYDVTLNQLERRLRDGRAKVRTKLTEILTPKCPKENTLTAHQSLLELSRDREGRTKLVTTNFDRIFEGAIERSGLDTPTFSAPVLPIPKASRWDGVVYLHGLLPEKQDDVALNRLVLSSGDFGLAYLTERWASRFVSELFRNYIVCFVGYGINDPVIRYMMDALAADAMLGGKATESYAFVSFQNEKEQGRSNEWEAKGVTPLLYETPKGKQDHSVLHRTLEEWADTYRDGVRGKEMIVTEHASTPPLSPSRSDFVVGQVLWALTDDLAAKRFAELNPAPPLEWLEPLSKNWFGRDDLSRFGILQHTTKNDSLKFSFLRRPAPYSRAPCMSIVDIGKRGSDWDGVMRHLASWLTRHLNDPKLVLWIVQQGGQLHESFIKFIRARMKLISKLEINNEQDKLDSIIANAPQAIPCKPMGTIWEVILTGRIKMPYVERQDIYQWVRRAKQGKITSSMRVEVRNLLAPCVTFRAPIHLRSRDSNPSQPLRIRDFVEWDLELASDDSYSAFYDQLDDQEQKTFLPNLLQDFGILLHDALDLMRDLDKASKDHDLSYYHRPSISSHPQNPELYNWTSLIDLTRDAWLATAQTDPRKARRLAEDWFHSDYLLTKRLAFFAATHNDVIAPSKGLGWLLSDNGKWLWSESAKREAMRLMVSLVGKLDAQQVSTLENAILDGPPDVGDISEVDRDESEQAIAIDCKVWSRLVKIADAGASLGERARNELDSLAKAYPNWELPKNERDGFSRCLEYGTSSYERQSSVLVAPRCRDDLIQWIEEHQNNDSLPRTGWPERCRDDVEVVIQALRKLAESGKWPEYFWRTALLIWKEGDLAKKSWEHIKSIIVGAPDRFLLSISNDIGLWLQSVASIDENKDEHFLGICIRMLRLDYEDEPNADEPLHEAINHPVGRVTVALVDRWHRESSEGDQRLPEKLAAIFTDLCNTEIEKFRYGRTILALYAVVLHSIDREWTTEHLLPLFDWESSTATEAQSVWAGLLESRFLQLPFLPAIKQSFLGTSKYYGHLGENSYRYVESLTHAALLNPAKTFSHEELSEASKSLPSEGLVETAQVLNRMFDGSKEQRKRFWLNRLLPYFRHVWPKSNDLITNEISAEIAQICITAGDMFPCVLKELKYLLEPAKHSGNLVWELQQSRICQMFPDDALEFLVKIVDASSYTSDGELRKCLEDIKNVNDQLAGDRRYTLMDELSRRHDH